MQRAESQQREPGHQQDWMHEQDPRAARPQAHVEQLANRSAPGPNGEVGPLRRKLWRYHGNPRREKARTARPLTWPPSCDAAPRPAHPRRASLGASIATPWAPPREQLQERCARQGRREHIALRPADAAFAQMLHLLEGLHTLGDDLHPHVAREAHQRLDDRRGISFSIKSIDEHLVDLDEIDAELEHVGQAAVTGAEIVDPDVHAEPLQRRDDAPRDRRDCRAPGAR